MNLLTTEYCDIFSGVTDFKPKIVRRRHRAGWPKRGLCTLYVALKEFNLGSPFNYYFNGESTYFSGKTYYFSSGIRSNGFFDESPAASLG